jgi:hypothetical protein
VIDFYQARGGGVRTTASTFSGLRKDQLVAGATFTAVYSGPNQGELSGVAGDDGGVVLRTKWVRNPQGLWCFEVTNVSKDGYVYNPGANVMSIQCEGN